MPNWKVYLTDGRTKVIRAETPKQARIIYYGSNDHFATESGITKVEGMTGIHKKTLLKMRPRKMGSQSKPVNPWAGFGSFGRGY